MKNNGGMTERLKVDTRKSSAGSLETLCCASRGFESHFLHKLEERVNHDAERRGDRGMIREIIEDIFLLVTGVGLIFILMGLGASFVVMPR